MNDMLFFIFFIIFVSIAVTYIHKLEVKTAEKDAQKAEIERAKKEALDRNIEAKKEKEEQEAQEAKKIADQKLAKLEKYKKALTFTTYELAEIVIDVVAVNNFDKLKEIASVLNDQMHIDEVTVEASKKLSSGYESAIKEISDTRCVNIDYSEKEVVTKLGSLVDSCIAIGTGAICKKIGLSPSSTVSSSGKGEIRKTKKWKDD